MRRYDLTPEAQRDIDSIAEYIALEATVDRAMRVLLEFRDAFRNLGEMPGMGHYREDLLDKRYKFWTVHSYVVVYRWETTPIQIIAVLHGARDLDALLGRREI